MSDGGGRAHGYSTRVFDAAAGDDPLAFKSGIGRIVSKPNQDVTGDDGNAGSGVKYDWNEKIGHAVHRLKQEINNDRRAGGIIGYSRHEKITTVSCDGLPVK